MIFGVFLMLRSMSTLRRSAASRAALTLLLLLASVLLPAAAFAAGTTTKVVSPTGSVVVTINIDDASAPGYCVEYRGTEVIGASALGLVFHDAADMTRLNLLGVSSRQIDETTTEPVGRKSTYRNYCTETTLETASASDPAARMNIVVRAYDDGFALRYAVPEGSSLADASGEFRVDAEGTGFAFKGDYDVLAAFQNGINGDQQGQYERKKLSDIKASSFVLKPLVVTTEEYCVALVESDLLDWAGSLFAASEKDPTTVVLRLAPRDDKRGCVIRKAPACSPWRAAIFGKTPVDLINNADIVYNCATPAKTEASWVKPGNSTWDWWAPKGSRVISDAKLREFIDFSAENGIRYTLVDAGWYKVPGAAQKATWDWSKGLEPNPSLNVPECVKYGKEKGVDVLLWMDWPHIVHTNLRETFKTVADWGVAGVKIDHMNSHSQEMVKALTDAVELAAEYKLLVNFHGMYVPTGLERTYPHQITREGIRGNEYFRGRALPVSHAITLAFTRMLPGPADYTPGGFRNEHLETYKTLKELDELNASCRVVGTRAHELALCMIYESPLRCYCDLPAVYKDQPGLDYLAILPCVWDDTVALAGAPEEYLVMARRSGTSWFVSAITNEEARETTTPLDFLDDDAEYEATFYVDAPESDTDACALAKETRKLRRGDAVTFKMVREGGANLVLKRL